MSKTRESLGRRFPSDRTLRTIDEPMLVPDLFRLEGLTVFSLVDLLENILESTIVPFENRILRRQVQRIALSRLVESTRTNR